MDMKLFALGLALPGLGALAAASPTTPSPIAFPAGSTVEVASAKPESSEFGQPLFVNGQRVTDNDIKRFLIYGPCRLMLEMYRVSLIIEDEIVRRCREAADAAIEPEVAKRAKTTVDAALEGKTFESPEARQKVADAETTKARAGARNDPALRKSWQAEFDKTRKLLDETLVPNETEYQAEVKRTMDEFKQNYPVLDVDAEVSRAFRTVDWYRTQLRQTMLFDRVFYPDDPEEWPITTVEAVRADSGDTLLTDARD